MKSSNKLLTNYFRILYQPTETVEDIVANPTSLLENFLLIILSGILLIAGVMIVGDALYSTFQYQVFSYPLEYLTDGQVFGYFMPYEYYGLTFLTDVIFVIKAWIFLGILLLVFLRVFKYKISIKQSIQIVTWSLFPYAIVMFATSMLCLGFKVIFPFIYHYIYFGVLAAVFLGIAPVIVTLFLEKLKGVSLYDSLRAYYLSLFIIFVIWTIGHADKFMLLVW
ncbi:MAG: YIP1 family protein [Candidatus Helarchaeota archaeon]